MALADKNNTNPPILLSRFRLPRSELPHALPRSRLNALHADTAQRPSVARLAWSYHRVAPARDKARKHCGMRTHFVQR